MFGESNDDQTLTNKIQRADEQTDKTGLNFVIRVSSLYNRIQHKVPEANQLDKMYTCLKADLITHFDRDTFRTYDGLVSQIHKYENKIATMQWSTKLREYDSKRKSKTHGKTHLNPLENLSQTIDNTEPEPPTRTKPDASVKPTQNTNKKQGKQQQQSSNNGKYESYIQTIAHLTSKIPKNYISRLPQTIGSKQSPDNPTSRFFTFHFIAERGEKRGSPARNKDDKDKQSNRHGRSNNNNKGKRGNSNRGRNQGNNWNAQNNGLNQQIPYFTQPPPNYPYRIQAPQQPMESAQQPQQILVMPQVAPPPWHGNYNQNFPNTLHQNLPPQSKNDGNARRD